MKHPMMIIYMFLLQFYYCRCELNGRHTHTQIIILRYHTHSGEHMFRIYNMRLKLNCVFFCEMALLAKHFNDALKFSHSIFNKIYCERVQYLDSCTSYIVYTYPRKRSQSKCVWEREFSLINFHQILWKLRLSAHVKFGGGEETILSRIWWVLHVRKFSMLYISCLFSQRNSISWQYTTVEWK